MWEGTSGWTLGERRLIDYCMGGRAIFQGGEHHEERKTGVEWGEKGTIVGSLGFGPENYREKS